MSENKQGTADTVDANLAQAVHGTFAPSVYARARRLFETKNYLYRNVFGETCAAAIIDALLLAEECVARVPVPPPEESIDG